MKKVLFITHQLPWPCISGGLFKTFKLTERLCRDHSVTFFVTDPEATPERENEFKEKLSLSNYVRLPFRLPRSAKTYLRSLIANYPLSIMRNRHESIRKEVERLAQGMDVIFVDHFIAFQHVPRWFKGKVILHQHNAEYVMWQGFAAQVTSPVKKLLLNLEAKRIATYEKRIANRADWVLCSPNDKLKLMELNISENKFKETLHLGDVELLDRPISNFDSLEDRILFIGTLTWEANIHGLKWFLEEVWPQVKHARLDIIGKCANEAEFSKWIDDPRINWHGFVEDLQPFYDRAKVFIAPLKFGSGIKVKVVNSLYRGLPTVTTSIGIEGMGIMNGEGIYFEDDSKEYASAINLLLKNKEEWEKCAQLGREYALEHLGWDKALQCLDEII